MPISLSSRSIQIGSGILLQQQAIALQRADDRLHARDIGIVRRIALRERQAADRRTARARPASRQTPDNVPSRSASSPAGSGVLYRFQPVNVPRGTAMSGSRMPASLVAVGIDLRHQRAAMSRAGGCGSVQSPSGATSFAARGGTSAASFGHATASARTSVPSAMRGSRDGGGSRPFATHSSSATSSARIAGIGSCQLRGLMHGPASRGMPALPPCCVPGR